MKKTLITLPRLRGRCQLVERAELERVWAPARSYSAISSARRQVGNETGSGTQTTRLPAATRAGLSFDIERRLTDRLALRVEGTFTRAPLAVKGSR